ncbi:Glycerol-3-phosphate acyltransferase [Bienertia sinuspersici]
MISRIPSSNSLPISLLHRRTHLFTPSITQYKLINSDDKISLLTLRKDTIHFNNYHLKLSSPSTLIASSNGNSDALNNELEVTIFGEKPVKAVLWVLFWTSVSLAVFAFSKDAKAASAVVIGGNSSIKASSFGLKVASFLRGSGWSDEAIVFALATLPVIELRGAIPVGYWMQLNPILLTVLSILGNMIPVPFIILYLKKIATFLGGKNGAASRFLNMLFERAKEKAGPVEEFQWLGLMLFVAVPFPGTGAWSGAIIASVLDIPFWSAVSANFFGVLIAGLLVNLLVNLGLKYAVLTAVLLFFVSMFMWSVLRSLKKSLNLQN